MYETEYNRIIKSSKTNALTLFVGAGVSTLSNAPKWKDMINKICDKLGINQKDNYSIDDYLQIPQIYYNEIRKDDDQYYSFLSDCLNIDNIFPNSIHKLLFKLKPSSILTTNFDELLETAAAQECYSMKVIASDTEVSSINGNRFILKVHGDLKHRNIVFKEEDYLSYSDNFKLTETILKSIFSTNTVVFVGYGLNDYNIKLVLNWAKNLLKDNFNKPIFIYTENAELTDAQMRYQESRGLSVIDFHKYVKAEEYAGNYLIRYQKVLEAILNSSDTITENKNKYKLFDILHKKLLPLKYMMALKPHDIEVKLSPHVIISNSGCIEDYPNSTSLLEYFFEICQMSKDEKMELPIDTKEKYKDILSVFKKGLLLGYKFNNKIYNFEGSNISFADENCLTFSYVKMKNFTNRTYTNIYINYKKAFYLAKLNKFWESYDLFSEVAIQSFKDKNYLLFYLSQINRNSLYQTMQNVNRTVTYFNSYPLKQIERVGIDFNQFPIEFQNDYNIFRDLSSASSLLYKNFYDSYIEGEKFENNIDNISYTFGTPISCQVMNQINNNLHFILGNHLNLDGFSEFKNAIKYLMSLLVRKYSLQNKKARTGSLQETFGSEKVVFDFADFYCFIEYFDSKEIPILFTRCKVETIVFANQGKVEKSVENIINYYDKVLSKSMSPIEVIPYQLKIKTCLELLRYMQMSQELVDKVCRFIFKYEFREITIGDKITFLHYQLGKRKMYSNVTKRVITNKFIQYFDEHLYALDNNQKFHMYSSSSLFYDSLIHYISDNIEDFYCPKLSNRVNKIIANNYSQMTNAIFEHYYKYLSKSQQKKVYSWASKRLLDGFDFSLFTCLLDEDHSVHKNIINELKIYLNKKISTIGEPSAIIVFPNKDKYDELIKVGYWCFIGILKHRDFKDFLGICDHFDFYFLYDKFDFSKFNFHFILNLRDHVYKKLSENEIVKAKIIESVSISIQSGELHPKDETALKDILIKYFY